MSGKWIAIPAVSAQAHPLYGVRGWLLAVLWLNTLPVLTSAMSVIAPMMYGGWKAASVTSFVALTWAVLSLGLVAVAFLCACAGFPSCCSRMVSFRCRSR